MSKYDYTIELEKIQDVTKEAIKAGCSAYLILNGEYYEIKSEIKPKKEKNFWEV